MAFKKEATKVRIMEVKVNIQSIILHLFFFTIECNWGEVAQLLLKYTAHITVPPAVLKQREIQYNRLFYIFAFRQCIISGHASFASVTYQPQAVIKSILVLNSHCINIMYLEEGGKKVACWDSGRGGTLWGDGFEKEETRCVDWLREIGETRC